MKKLSFALTIVVVASLVVTLVMLLLTHPGFSKPLVARAAGPHKALGVSKPPGTELTCSEPVRVGVMTDLTGPLALYGAHIERSFRLGMEYGTGTPGPSDVYNLDGCEIRVLWGDDQSNSDTAETVARDLIEVDGVDILVGTVSSGVTVVLQDLAVEYGIVHIAAPAASNDITGINFTPNTFRTSRSSYQDAANLCEYLGSQQATLVQIAPDYSWGWETAKTYRDACGYFGARFVADDIFSPLDTTDFGPYLEQILDSGADSWIVTWAGGGFTLMMEQAGQLGVMDEMDLAISFADNESMAALFSDTVGTTGGIVYHYTSPHNAINDWLVQETKARHGIPPDLFYADGMNAALLILEAIQATDGDVSADALITAMEGMQFEGPKGTVTIRPEDHVAIQDLYIVTLLNVDDPDYAFFGHVTGFQSLVPCMLPEELQDRCGGLPVGTLVRRVYLPLVLHSSLQK
jgi:branched-chain amino acid transport system substrate-binding protein